jgi:hypothetical protein
MRRRRSLLLALAVLIIAGVLALMPWRDRSREAYDRVRAGMTRAEVRALLGTPCGPASRAPEGYGPGREHEVLIERDSLPATDPCWWVIDGGIVVVEFNGLGQAKRKSWWEPEGPLQRLVRLGWKWLP